MTPRPYRYAMPTGLSLGTPRDASGTGSRGRRRSVRREHPCTGQGCCRRQGDRSVVRDSHEWLGEREGSSPYSNIHSGTWRKSLSPDTFCAYDSSLHTLQAPLQDPSGTKLCRADPATSAHARALLDVQGACGWFGGAGGCCKGVCDAMPGGDVPRPAPPSIL